MQREHIARLQCKPQQRRHACVDLGREVDVRDVTQRAEGVGTVDDREGVGLRGGLERDPEVEQRETFARRAVAVAVKRRRGGPGSCGRSCALRSLFGRACAACAIPKLKVPLFFSQAQVFIDC